METHREIKNIIRYGVDYFVGKIKDSMFGTQREQNKFQIKLQQGALPPKPGSNGAAGYDLYAYIPEKKEIKINPGERVLVPTGISLSIGHGKYGRVAPRSGLALKHGIDVLAGVIDSDYTGEIGVVLLNTDSEAPFVIKHGDRIAQIIFESCFSPSFEIVDELVYSDRSTGGFGSTGI